MFLRNVFCLLSLGIPLGSIAGNLYATHSGGFVYTISINRDVDSDVYSLSALPGLTTCGSFPSWLTFDPTLRVLYCSDKSGNATTSAAVYSLAITENGSPTQLAKTTTPGGGVHSTVYNGVDGNQFLAIAHYAGSAISTFRLPLEENEDPLQVFRYTMPNPGPNPLRQDTPHPHQIILDPTGSFVLVPDLGADLVRVLSIDKRSGKLNTCPSLNFPPGSGPRHGLFWAPSLPTERKAKRGRLQPLNFILYMLSELSGKLSAFSVSYRNDCLFFQHIQSLIPYPGGSLPKNASLSEIRMSGSSLYVSIRSDHSFPPDDSIVTLARSPNGTVNVQQLSSSYGVVPSTFVINQSGDLVAIGNQLSSNVAVVRRDSRTGELGGELANVQVGEPGRVGTPGGLSSIVWVD
ncbi:6-phosphogluconolactonase [Aspergillus cavernicola]|uniref:6-phosphogluconolactonase n=1 Tax=Aspergillus cavernicola TaxID=176166 RepID=A0ABR4HTL1_9EURO